MTGDYVAPELHCPQLINFTAFGEDRAKIEKSLKSISESWALLAEVDRVTTLMPYKRQRHAALRDATEDGQGNLEREVERMVIVLRESEQRLTHQRNCVDGWRARGADTRQSEALLATFEASLAIRYQQLARLRALREMSKGLHR